MPDLSQLRPKGKGQKTVSLNELAKRNAGHWLNIDETKAKAARIQRDVYDKDGPIQPELTFGPLDAIGGAIADSLIGESGAMEALQHAGVPPWLLMAAAPMAGGAKGAFSKAAVRGETKAELKAMRAAELTGKEAEKLKALTRANPTLKEATNFMTPVEIKKTIASRPNTENLVEIYSQLPPAEQLAAVAKAGTPKKGWYEASEGALVQVFGEQDAPRFAGLLAALSPQTSVEMNLKNTLNTWKNWTAAGRPTDEASIFRILGQSVVGNKGADSVLPAWRGNAVRALATPNVPVDLTLSGPKVDSFFRNLAGHPYSVTNDAWMANGLGVDQGLFAGSGLTGRDPGFGPGYNATSSRMREAGQLAGMHPREAQETTWSVFMPLYELARKHGISPSEVLQRGLLTPEAIRGTPDFSTLLKQGEYGSILDRAGYGDQLRAMKGYQWPTQTPSLSIGDQRHLTKATERLDTLGDLRKRETRSTQVAMPQSGYPDTVMAVRNGEVIPYGDSGHLPGLKTAGYDKGADYTARVAGATQDLQGIDRMNQAVLPNQNITDRRFTGSWQAAPTPDNPNPKPEVNAGTSSITEVPVRTVRERVTGPDGKPQTKVRPALYGSDEAKLRATAALHGAINVQAGVPVNALVPGAGGNSMVVPLVQKEGMKNTPLRVAIADMGNAMQVKRPDLALADTGNQQVNVLNWGDPVAATEANALSKALGGDGTAVPAHSVGPYIDFETAWQQPQGSGAVTKQLFEELKPLAKKDYRALDQAIRPIAGGKYKIDEAWAAKQNDVVRKDVMNMLKILETQGLDGLKQALDSGAFLPALGALGLIGAAQQDRASESTRTQ